MKSIFIALGLTGLLISVLLIRESSAGPFVEKDAYADLEF